MVDQNSQFYAILTNVGAAKQANADALGIAWKITQMGVGDANDTEPTPNASQISLINEWRRAPLNQLKIDDKDNSIIVAEQVIPAEVGGRWIREIGLYDADGDLVAVANCPPTYKPLLNQGSGRTQVVRMNLVVSSSSNVELKIDPAVVLATREWVTSELHKQDFKHSVLAATTSNIALTGLQTIDGVALTAGARVLVKNQAAGKDNGLYTVAASAWTRCPDADVSTEVTPGLLVLVERGTVNGDSAWQLVTDAPITVGVSALVFEMAFGRSGVAAGTYRSVTVDKYGRVVAATNPTTVEGYGLTDVYTKTQVDDLLGAAGWGAKGVSGSNIPVGTNLNAMTVPGSYGQTQNANATLALNYPVAAAGTLLVQAAGPQITTQQYTMYLTNRIFFRTSYGGSWDDWDEIPTVNSPKLTGIPEAPTAPKGTNTQQVATTAFVRGEVAGLVDSAPGALDTLKELAAAMGNDPNFATTVLDGLGSKVNVADKASKQIAEAGVDNAKWMTALSTLQSIIKQLNNIGLGITSAPLLPSFEAVVPGGFYLAYSGGASNPTPGGPPSIGNNVLGVFAITPRQDGSHFIAIENGGASSVRRIWFGQYNVINGVPTMFWSYALTSDHIATQDQVDTGAADDVLVTPKKMRFGAIWSFAPNGYFFLPKWLGGFGLQWGIRAAAIPSSDSGAVSFPMSFASVFQVMAIPHGTAPLTTPLTLKTGAPTLTGVTFYVDGPVGGGGNVTPRWLALGRI